MRSSAEPRVGAVIVAAGSGRRMGGVRKQYLELAGRPVLEWALTPFVQHPRIDAVIAVLPADEVDDPPDWLAAMPVTRAAGGAERADSVRAGLDALPAGIELVVIHDGARPLVREEVIDATIAAAANMGAAIAAAPVTDTIKRVAAEGRIVATVDRSELWAAQTPQAFRLADLRAAHRRAADEGIKPTDDAALFERYGMEVRVIESGSENLKITRPTDLAIAEALLATRAPAAAPEEAR